MTGEMWVIVVALVVVVLLAVTMGRRLTRFTIRIFGLRAEAEGERPHDGLEVTRSRAGGDLVADTRGGQTRVDRFEAGGDIRISHVAVPSEPSGRRGAAADESGRDDEDDEGTAGATRTT